MPSLERKSSRETTYLYPFNQDSTVVSKDKDQYTLRKHKETSISINSKSISKHITKPDISHIE